MNRKPLYKQLKSELYRNNKIMFALAVIASVCSGTVGLAFSWTLKALMDTASGSESALPFMSVLKIIAVILVLSIIFALMDYLTRPVFIKRAMTQYKDFAFEKLTTKSISSFRDENTAAYISALTNDATRIETDYLGNNLKMITKAVSFFGSLALMLITSPVLTLVAIAVMSLPILVSVLTSGKMVNAEKNVSDRNTEFVTGVSDCLRGFKVVKSFKAEKEVCGIFSSDNNDLEDGKYKREKFKTIIASLGALAGALAQVGVFLFGTLMCLKGWGLTPGIVIMFVNLMNFLIYPVSELPAILAGRKASLALIEKMADALEMNVEKNDGAETASLNESIRLENVSFGYDDKKEVLHDINVEFKAGRSYAIVGGSGSGKSTLLNLLMNSSRDYKGSIFYDDSELKNISSESLYDEVSMIQQDVFVFNSSVKNNVTMFKEFDKEEIDEAISRAKLDGFIKEKGEDYLCGENGKGLSGGEKQRISIARTLLKKSKVLLADEATSALDAETAFQVTDDILNLTGILRIVITHSLDEILLRRYDEILVLKDGRIEEKGRFEDLISKKGYFYALYTVAH